MTLPSPRSSSDSTSRDEATCKAAYLAAFERVYDGAREAGVAQLVHVAAMIEANLGGTLVVKLPSKITKRSHVEAAYIGELEGVKIQIG